MPVYLIVAYGIFFAIPLGLGISIGVRRRRVEREIAALEAKTTRSL